MERKGFIGGSDCTKIMEGYWLELWKVKTGREEPESLRLLIYQYSWVGTLKTST